MGHGKCLLKVFELLKVVEDMVCQPILGRDGGNIGSVFSPHDVSLMKAVKPGKPGAVPPPMEKNKTKKILLFFCSKAPMTSKKLVRLGIGHFADASLWRHSVDEERVGAAQVCRKVGSVQICR